ncbi:hypothetical protein EON65_17005 [archaeon]|nr:MAG: hypothetical protein EON65_17005 [archaeon]
MTNFKHSLKAHGKHLEERSKRVQQYGHSENSGVQSAVLSQSGKYAMFGAPSSGDGLGGFGQTPVGLHHRGGALGSQPSPASTTPAIRSYSGLNSNAASSGSANKGHHHQHHHHHQQQQQQQQVYKSNNGYRLHAAEKVESTIKQVYCM